MCETQCSRDDEEMMIGFLLGCESVEKKEMDEHGRGMQDSSPEDHRAKGGVSCSCIQHEDAIGCVGVSRSFLNPLI